MTFSAIMTLAGIVFMAGMIGLTVITFMKNVNSQSEDDNVRW